MSVKAWKEEVNIPTYEIGEAEKIPVFSEKRVYQGSSGVVYPHPVVEKISDEKTNKTYLGYFLENEYLKIMILPELGGRVQMAFDKVKNRHFVYYNQVIKPALVGLTGPWISGGIEFNWPQHHRPSTFNPVDATIVNNADGSCTIWVNEVEIMFRTKGMAGFTLYPSKAYLEIEGRLYNRTPFPQTFLWWANPAVKVNEHYQSVFPPDVHAVFDHGKRDVSSFPIAKGVYYKVDYAPGTDISRYKNIPVPTSYMAIASKYNFIGGYEHDTQAGVLHVADHHVSPGKKQWTWGNGDFGQAWDRNLTDEDGPYIEIMTGMFTDNQPDFSWLQPQEEKTFKQYFMPYSKAGVVKNASRDAAINLWKEGKETKIVVYATGVFENAVVEIKCKNQIIEKKATISPENVFEDALIFAEEYPFEELEIIVKTQSGEELISYKAEKEIEKEIPQAALPAQDPRNIDSNDLLFINGLHIEQYRHATYVATDYYEEALRRDPHDIRNNNALGLWYLRRGKFERAEQYFRKAIKRLTLRNPNPYDGEPLYNLGWALKMQGKIGEAFDAFYKSSWNDAMQHAAFFNLARIACIQNDYQKALDLIQKSLYKNWRSHSVRHLKVAILRKLKYNDLAIHNSEESLEFDRFNYGCLFEKYLLYKQNKNEFEANAALHELISLMRGAESNYLEYAIDYAHAGMYKEANELLKLFTDNHQAASPMAHYHMAYNAKNLGDINLSKEYLQTASKTSSDFCFPHRIEDILVLQMAMQESPDDSKAPYYLGNLWYDKRQYTEAQECWEKSIKIDDSFAIAYRNLALAYHNKLHDSSKALDCMEQAFRLDPENSRILMEIDQLYKITNKPQSERLQIFSTQLNRVKERDDLFIEYASLLNNEKNFLRVQNLLASRNFHPWEGGEGKVVKQYLISLIELAKESIMKNEFTTAKDYLDKACIYPLNLGEGKLFGTQENDIHYLMGLIFELEGNIQEAEKYYQLATVGISEPVQAIFYNDPQPDKIFYQGLAWYKLKQCEKASKIFNRFIEFGNKHMNDNIKIDYFAVSLPDLLVFDQDLNLKNKIHCLYLKGLGYLGLTDYENATRFFNSVLELDNSHQGAIFHKDLVPFLKSFLSNLVLS